MTCYRRDPGRFIIRALGKQRQYMEDTEVNGEENNPVSLKLRCVTVCVQQLSYALLAVLINLPALLTQFAYRDTHRVETITETIEGAADA